MYYGCVSGPTSSQETALSLQIRWQESDLPNFETPPLPSGPPSSRRHGGWDPESSLTYVYTFEPDCSTLTNRFLLGSRTSCAPLTGNYYSPAICPSGWTAALSRPLLSGGGPPVEADETAMLCCPVGMTTLSVSANNCGPRECISTTVYSTGHSGLTMEVLAVRYAIQIRWASSDLSGFETHPLTPGTIPTERLSGAGSNYTGLFLPLQPKYAVAIGLSLLPILLAGALITFGLGVRKWKEDELIEKQQQPPPVRTFKPRVLRYPTLTLIIGIGITLTVLLELSYRVLPTADNPPEALEHIQVTKTFLSDITWLSGNHQTGSTSTSTPTQLDLTCVFTGSYSVTTIKTSYVLPFKFSTHFFPKSPQALQDPFPLNSFPLLLTSPLPPLNTVQRPRHPHHRPQDLRRPNTPLLRLGNPHPAPHMLPDCGSAPRGEMARRPTRRRRYTLPLRPQPIQREVPRPVFRLCHSSDLTRCLVCHPVQDDPSACCFLGGLQETCFFQRQRRQTADVVGRFAARGVE